MARAKTPATNKKANKTSTRFSSSTPARRPLEMGVFTRSQTKGGHKYSTRSKHGRYGDAFILADLFILSSNLSH